MDDGEFLEKKIRDVLRFYKEIDGVIADFRAASDLRCAVGCGRCCENPRIFVTVLEVLPLAYALWKKGSAGQLLELLRAKEDIQVCVFYRPRPGTEGLGRCDIYPFRPLVCRLFGFAVKIDQRGVPQMVTCQAMKANCRGEFARTNRALKMGKLKAPVMQDCAMEVMNLDPHLGIKPYPMNLAVRIALEKIGMMFQYR